MKMMTLFYTLLLSWSGLLIDHSTTNFGTFTDPRDGRTYQTVNIGQQTWLAENLSYKMEGSFCYDNHPFNCRKFGRLYNYEAALNACPDGWRLPNDTDWNKLYRHFGNATVAYAEMIPSGKSGFSVKMAGWLSQNYSYEHQGERAYFWSASEIKDGYVHYYRLDTETRQLTRSNSVKHLGFSCRCIRE